MYFVNLSAFNVSGAVFFYAEMDGDESPSQHHILHFDNVKYNIGNGYDKYVGAFVVSITGTYVFTWSISVGSSSSYHICTNLVVNDAEYGILYTDPYGSYEKDSSFVVAQVEVGDVVFVRTCSSPSLSGKVLSASSLHTSSFAGWLI